MKLFRSLAIFALIAAFAHPAALRGQAESGARIFTSINNSFPGGSGHAGIGVSLGRGTEYRVGISYHVGSRRVRVTYSSRSNEPARSRPKTGNTRGGSRTSWPASATASSEAARRVVPDAEQYIGVPYVYGGDSPRGFDCSGFVRYVYAREGVDLPRTSRQMAGSGRAVRPTPNAMAIGDLMLFAQGGRISHVAIYAGSGRFIHSSSSGKGVRYDDLSTERGQWFADHLVAARRVAGKGSAAMKAYAASEIPFDRFDPPDSAPPAGKH